MVSEIIQFLTSQNKNAYAEEPTDAPENYYIVEQTGGTIEDYIESIQITVQSYGPSLADALSNNGELIDLMGEFAADDSISSVSLNSYYNYTDTDKKKYRYQAVFDIVPF